MKCFTLIVAWIFSSSVLAQLNGREVSKLDELFLSSFEKMDFQCRFESITKHLECDPTNPRNRNNTDWTSV